MTDYEVCSGLILALQKCGLKTRMTRLRRLIGVSLTANWMQEEHLLVEPDSQIA